MHSSYGALATMIFRTARHAMLSLLSLTLAAIVDTRRSIAAIATIVDIAAIPDIAGVDARAPGAFSNPPRIHLACSARRAVRRASGASRVV